VIASREAEMGYPQSPAQPHERMGDNRPPKCVDGVTMYLNWTVTGSGNRIVDRTVSNTHVHVSQTIRLSDILDHVQIAQSFSFLTGPSLLSPRNPANPASPCHPTQRLIHHIANSTQHKTLKVVRTRLYLWCCLMNFKQFPGLEC
jgi:hypothetical protein